MIDREPAPIEVLLLWGGCHVEWLSEGWYICHNKQMQLWHVTFATRALLIEFRALTPGNQPLRTDSLYPGIPLL